MYINQIASCPIAIPIPTHAHGTSLQTHVTLHLGYFSGHRMVLNWHTGQARSARELTPRCRPSLEGTRVGGSPEHVAHSIPEAPATLSHSCPQQQAHINTHCGVVSFPSQPPLLSIGTSGDHVRSETLLFRSLSQGPLLGELRPRLFFL